MASELINKMKELSEVNGMSNSGSTEPTSLISATSAGFSIESRTTGLPARISVKNRALDSR